MDTKRYDDYLDFAVLICVAVLIVGLAGAVIALVWHLFKMS